MRGLAAAAAGLVLASAGAAAVAPGRIVYTITVASQQLYHASASGHVLHRLTAAVTQSTDPVVSPDGRTLAYAADPHGALDIFTRPVAGGPATNLTRAPGDDYQPAWSPDGARIAFVSERASTNPQVFVMDADGSHVAQVTHDTLTHELPSWSPDGKRILFDSSGRKGPGDVYAVNDDGSGLTRLTSSKRDEWAARWSPDGAWIAYTTEVLTAGDAEPSGYIWLVRPDGTGAHQIPKQPDEDLTYPNWSADSRTIAFSEDHGDCGIWTMALDGSRRKLAAPVCDLAGSDASGDHLFWAPDRSFWFASAPSGNSDVAIVPAGGGDPTALTHDNVASEMQPALSPDGKLVAFTSDRTQANNIWLMHADGTKPHDISRSVHDDEEADWSPDGKQIAFATNRGPNKAVEIYVMRSDGSHQRAVTTAAGSSNQPAWSPDGRWLAFSSFPARSGRGSVWLVRPNGTGLRRLGYGESPVWSPSGRTLAFLRRGHVWRIDANGAHARMLAAGSDPSWSPGGRELAYARTLSESGEHGPMGNGPARQEIWAMSATGGDQRRIAVSCDDAESADPRFPLCSGGTPQLKWGR